MPEVDHDIGLLSLYYPRKKLDKKVIFLRMFRRLSTSLKRERLPTPKAAMRRLLQVAMKRIKTRRTRKQKRR